MGKCCVNIKATEIAKNDKKKTNQKHTTAANTYSSGKYTSFSHFQICEVVVFTLVKSSTRREDE